MLTDTSGPLTMTYDEENRLRQLQSGATIATYSYDGDNLKRTEMALNGAITTLVWDGDEYLQERS